MTWATILSTLGDTHGIPSRVVEHILSNNISSFSQLNLHQYRNGITSNRQCDGWNEARSVNNLSMAELLRTEPLGHSSKFYSGYKECNMRLPVVKYDDHIRLQCLKLLDDQIFSHGVPRLKPNANAAAAIPMLAPIAKNEHFSCSLILCLSSNNMVVHEESGEASDWTANWNGDYAPLAGGRKQGFCHKREIHEVGNYSSAKVRVCEDMIMKPTVERQDMQELGRPPYR
ncbi:hypothetical protein SASPL_150441 [Salvia splendens]|uniref:Uncharacterized protein n=1 Tax=Salvia splendens TaxID=180675 RepID=A0A8X8W7C2_SALSN|nr:hypothetical protein SASPL_150441 [Salvia splendens]